MKKDYRKEPFKYMVTIGDSITAGGSATKSENSWAGILAEMISGSQPDKIGFFNAGMGGNVISGRCPRFEEARKPSSIERRRRDIVSRAPDLVVIAYSTNEMFFGMTPEMYAEELDFLVKEVKDNTGALVVLLGPYFMPENTDPESPYNKGGYGTAVKYNKATRKCAEKNEALFADVFSAIGQAWWIVDTDNVHLNDIGHRAVACKVFETIALNCSALSVRSYEAAKVRPTWRDESQLMTYDDI